MALGSLSRAQNLRIGRLMLRLRLRLRLRLKVRVGVRVGLRLRVRLRRRYIEEMSTECLTPDGSASRGLPSRHRLGAA